MSRSGQCSVISGMRSRNGSAAGMSRYARACLKACEMIAQQKREMIRKVAERNCSASGWRLCPAGVEQFQRRVASRQTPAR